MPQLVITNKDTIKKNFGIYDPNEVKHWDFVDGNPEVWEAAFVQMANAGIPQNIINKAYNRIRIDSSAMQATPISLHLLEHLKLAEPPSDDTLDAVLDWLSDAFGTISGKSGVDHSPELNRLEENAPDKLAALGALSLFDSGINLTGNIIDDDEAIELAGNIAYGCINGQLPYTANSITLINKILEGNKKFNNKEQDIYDKAIGTVTPVNISNTSSSLPKSSTGKEFGAFDWKSIDFGKKTEPVSKPAPVQAPEVTVPADEPVTATLTTEVPVEPVSTEPDTSAPNDIRETPVEPEPSVGIQEPEVSEPSEVADNAQETTPETVEPVTAAPEPEVTPEPVVHPINGPAENTEPEPQEIQAQEVTEPAAEDIPESESDDDLENLVVAEPSHDIPAPRDIKTPDATEPESQAPSVPEEKPGPVSARTSIKTTSKPGHDTKFDYVPSQSIEKRISVPQKVLMEIFSHAGSREQIADAVRLAEQDIRDNTPNAQFLVRYVPGVTQEIVKDILANRTASGQYITRSVGKSGEAIPHTSLTGGSTYVSGDRTRKIGPVEIPPGFAQENSSVLWDEPVITTMGYPFINFGAPEIRTILKDKDEKRVKEAYKKLKKQLKKVGLSSPIKILKDFKDSKGVRCALNRITVNADDLLENGNSTVRATVFPRATSVLKAPIGTIPLTRDFIVEMYKVLSPTRGARIYMDTLGMSEEEYADILNYEGRPPFYIFVPKDNLLFKKAPSGFIARLFTSNSKPTLVESKIGSHFGGFVMPFRSTRLLFAEI